MSGLRAIAVTARFASVVCLAGCATRFVPMVPPDDIAHARRTIAVHKFTEVRWPANYSLSKALAILEITSEKGEAVATARSIASADTDRWVTSRTTGYPTYVHFREAAEPQSDQVIVQRTCRSRRGALGATEAGAFWIFCYRDDHETRSRPWFELGAMDHEVVIFRDSYDRPECRFTVRDILGSVGIRPADRDWRPGRTDVNDDFRIILSEQPGRFHVVRSYPRDFPWPDFPTSLVVTADDCGKSVSKQHFKIDPSDQIFALREHDGGYWLLAGRTGVGNRLKVITPDARVFPITSPVGWHGLRVAILPDRQSLMHYESEGQALVEVEQNVVTGAIKRTRFDFEQVFESRHSVPALMD